MLHLVGCIREWKFPSFPHWPTPHVACLYPNSLLEDDICSTKCTHLCFSTSKDFMFFSTKNGSSNSISIFQMFMAKTSFHLQFYLDWTFSQVFYIFFKKKLPSKTFSYCSTTNHGYLRYSS